MNLLVDTEKLEWGLEKGIEQTDTYFAHLPQEMRLRHTACGLVSAAIRSYALDEGLPARLLIASPKVPVAPSMQHVVALLETEPHNPLVIDASVSQFLGYTGISTALESYVGEPLFPSEKVLAFGLQDTHIVVEWLSEAVRSFRAQHDRSAIPPLLTTDTPLLTTPLEDVRHVYEQIYNPHAFKTWMPPAHVMREGDIVAASIPAGAIEVC